MITECQNWARRDSVTLTFRARNRGWRTGPVVQTRLRPVEREALNLSDRAQAILGPNGVARFQEFWAYDHGWDFGRGQSLNPRSVAVFERFIAQFGAFGERRPSIFLSRDGNLVLAWEDATGERVEIEFGRDRFIVFTARDDAEREFSVEREADSLVHMLEQLNDHA
jgi:hypothetical protein